MDNLNENNVDETSEKTPDIKNKKKPKKPKKFFKFLLVLLIIFVILAGVWAAFAFIGRVNTAYIIPDSASLRISISNPVDLIDKILAHESLDDISKKFDGISDGFSISSFVHTLRENIILNNKLIKFIARQSMELALLSQEEGHGKFAAAWDLGIISPVMRILPVISNFVNIPNLYYLQAGSNSRFEYRMENSTFYIGAYRNLLLVTDSVKIFESRSVLHSGHSEAFSEIKPSSYDAALMLSNEFIGNMLAEQDSGIAELINNVEFGERVEAGLNILPRKIDFHLAVPLSSRRPGLSRILEQRSAAAGIAERIPADAQYATILSAAKLDELYQAALVFTPGLDDALKTAETASRIVLGITLNDLLFSWTGNEFAAFAIEGRPHPVYAIQVADERKRQEVFNKAFKSIVLNENVRLNLDGTRIPRIEIPEFFHALLRRWNVFIPSPYYYVHRDYLYVSESAETLLSALRAIQRNEVLPKTAEWRNISGGRTSASSLSLYYSLDISIPFFLRSSTALSGFLSLYKQGLIRMSFNKGIAEMSVSLIPGSGRGVTPVSGYPVAAGARPSNRVSGAGERVFISSGSTALSVNISNNNIIELSGQGNHWIIPADGSKNADNAWIVTDRGRVTLVDGDLNIASGFPVLMGLWLSAPPVAYEGRVYLCDEDGKVHTVDENGRSGIWETDFDAALRSPPSFISIKVKNNTRTYASAYPKSFFGEIWLLDLNGRAIPNWPASIIIEEDEDDDFDFDIDTETGLGSNLSLGSSLGSSSSPGLGFGSPLLFAHNSRALAAYVNQSGLLFVFDEDARHVKPFPLDLSGVFYQQPVFDGEYLWLVSEDGTLFRINMDGDIHHQNIPGLSVKEEGYIRLFDCDNDNVQEIFITGEGNALHGYTRHFRSLENFPLPVWGRPYFIPARGSRKAEIFGIGMSNMQLYRWQFR